MLILFSQVNGALCELTGDEQFSFTNNFVLDTKEPVVMHSVLLTEREIPRSSATFKESSYISGDIPAHTLADLKAGTQAFLRALVKSALAKLVLLYGDAADPEFVQDALSDNPIYYSGAALVALRTKVLKFKQVKTEISTTLQQQIGIVASAATETDVLMKSESCTAALRVHLDNQIDQAQV
jgi:hypothetical protein